MSIHWWRRWSWRPSRARSWTSPWAHSRSWPSERNEIDRQWQKRIEAARYEAERAARRYHQVEPENRLVARTLEAEWNERLEEVRATGEGVRGGPAEPSV